MKTTNIFSVIIILLLFINSCTQDDWLNTKPLSFFAPENIYINEEGFNALIITMQKDIKGEHYLVRGPMCNEYAMSDIGVPGAQANTVAKDLPRVLTPSGDGGAHDFPGRLFNLAYNSIRNANVLISRIDVVEWKNESTRNKLLASAYFYRSYWYYRLVNSYGDVPFIGEEITSAKLDFYTHSRWAILDKIQKDMLWAVDWLPENAKPGFATKGAANHLLAKIALANTDFDAAIEAATNVINGPYELMTERFGVDANDEEKNVIWDLHRVENMHHPSNTEMIYGVIDRFNDPEGAKTNGHVLSTEYAPAWWHSRVRDSEGKNGMISDGPQYDTFLAGNSDARPTPYYLYEIWDYENDIRRSDANWIEWYEILYNNPESVDYGKPVDRANFANPVDTFQHSHSFPFYKTYVPKQVPGRPQRYGGNGDYYIFRLAETYLIRAESYYWKKDFVNAANDLNKVRQRAGALAVNPNEVDIDFIFDERARELYTESPRHGELVRASFIMAKNNIDGYSLDNFSDKNWFYDRVMAVNLFFQIHLTWGAQSYWIAPHNALWPIPESIINSNTLGVINQNQGYFGAEKNIPPLEIVE